MLRSLVFGLAVFLYATPTLATPSEDCVTKSGKAAIAACTEVIKSNPKNANAYGSRGIAYDDVKDYDRAIADYSKAIELIPDDYATYFNRSNAYRDRGDADLAIADLDKSIELSPKFADAYSNRGMIYNDKGDYDHAMAEQTGTLQDQLEEIRVQLAWVRDYL